jgi:hypothetical protein
MYVPGKGMPHSSFQHSKLQVRISSIPNVSTAACVREKRRLLKHSSSEACLGKT